MLIASNFDKQVDDVTPKEELKSITDIVAGRANIESIEGVEYLENLEYMDIAFNRIIEIPESIGGLSNLKNSMLAVTL